MKLRSLCLGLTGSLLASVALAQTLVPQNVERAANTGVQPYIPQDRGNVAQSFSPRDFRVQTRPDAIVDPRAAQPVRADAVVERAPVPVRTLPSGGPVYAPAETRPTVAPSVFGEQRPAERAPAQVQMQAPTPDVRPFGAAAPRQPAPMRTSPLDMRQTIVDARPGTIDPRVVIPRREEFIDYKPSDGRSFDFRPADFKPVDVRAVEYRSQENKTPDQKVLDPRLKDKGPEIQANFDCRAIMYRSVECNYLDYREVDPRLQELFGRQAEVAFGIVPNEFSKDIVDKWQPLLAYLSAQIGLKVTLKVANDYAVLAESQRAGVVHIAIYSPLAYARARATGVKIEAFAVETNAEGRKGYHSVIYSMASGRPEDGSGKTMGLVDPNSLSGNFVPRLMTAAQKADFDTNFKPVYTGSHENAMTALAQGLVDYAVGEWRSEEDSTLTRVINRGVKSANGSSLRRDDFRVVAKSDLMPNAPVVFLSDLPEDIKATIRRTFAEAPMRERAAFDRIYGNKAGWDAVDGKAYDSATDLLKIVDESRTRQQASLASTQGR